MGLGGGPDCGRSWGGRGRARGVEVGRTVFKSLTSPSRLVFHHSARTKVNITLPFSVVSNRTTPHIHPPETTDVDGAEREGEGTKKRGEGRNGRAQVDHGKGPRPADLTPVHRRMHIRQYVHCDPTPLEATLHAVGQRFRLASDV